MSDEYIHEEFEKDALFAVLSEAENLANLGGWDWDIVKNKWTFSDNWLRIHGLSKRHLETSELLNIAHPDDRPDIQKALDKAITENAPYEIEHRIIRQDTGEKRYVKAYGRGKLDSDGKVVKIYGAAQDITEHKQSQAEIERMQYSIDMISDSVFWVDEAGIFLNVNKAACRNLGYSRDELMSMGVADIDPHFTSEKWPSHWEEMKRCRVMKIESTHKTKDGRLFPVEAVIHNQQFGDIHYNCVLVRDITERKKAEEKLIESEALFRGMFNDHSAVMLLIDPDTGQIIKANQAAVQYYGYPLEKMLQNKIQQLNISSREQITEQMHFALNKQINIFEFQHLLADGQVRDVEVHSTPITIQHQKLLFSIIRDITERKRAEEALQKSLTRYNELAANVPVGVYVFWIRTNGHMEFEYVSDRYCEIYQLDREDVLSDYTLAFDTVHPDERKDHLASNQKAFHDRKPFIWEGRFIIGGELCWLHVESTPEVFANGDTRWFGIIQDITQRKQAEESLVRQQRSIKLSNRIANIFLTSSMDEVFADVLDVLLKSLDSRFGYFGYIDESGDLVCPSMTRDVWDQCQVAEKSIVFPRAVWGGLWGRSLMEKQTLVSNENLRVPEGHVALENALATPIVHHDKLIGQFVLANKTGGYDKDDPDLLESVAAQTAPILFAIQEKARQKTAHEKLEGQLRQAQKMESVGRLAGGVAHDFNNMLSVILGHTEMALEQLDSSEPLHADLEEIQKAAKRSADITRQLLAFARKQTIAPKVLDLNATVEGMLKMLRRLIGEHIDLAWQPTTNLWQVRMDPSQVDQILANLCVNARDAITEVGKITIDTGTAMLDEDYCADHPGCVPGDFVMLMVSDDGCGMDQEIQANLFEPFFTTKGVDKGTGLGLATVYGIVKQNNGFIDVASEPGRGTIFRIYLPRHEAPLTPVLSKDPLTPDTQGSETILLVEDEPSILRMTRMMLERMGYKVLTAGTPGEAIALAREQAGEVHLLMTDVVMPEMNGRDLAKNLLSLYPNLKRLFMSGYTANVIAHHGVLDEGVHFIEKPFSKQDLAIKVREVLDEAK